MVEISIRSAAVAAAAVAFSTAACDEGSPLPSSQKHPRRSEIERPGEPDFDWRSALERPPSAARSALGAPEDCQPDRKLPALQPQFKGYFEDDIRKCHFPDAGEASDGRYYVDAILYSDKFATAVILRPSEAIPLSTDVFSDFHIRRPPVSRRRIVDWEGQNRRVWSFRADKLRGKIDRTSPIAVDLVAEPDAPDQLAFVRIGVASGWPYSIEHVQLAGPSPVGESLLIPRTNAGEPLEYGLSLEISPERFSVRPQRRFPIRRNGDDREFTPRGFDLAVLDGDASADGKPWQVQVENLARRWIQQRRELGKVPTPVLYTIYPTQTTPYRHVARATSGIEQATDSTFRIAGRLVEPLGAPFDSYVRMRTLPGRFRTGSMEEASVAIAVSTDGFDVRIDGESLPSADDCPDSGPTFCLTEEIDVSESFERARSLQRDGKWAKSDGHVERVLSAYDWTGLYNRLSSLAADRSQETTLAVAPARDLAFAVPFRVVQLVRRRVTLPDSDGCLETIPEETSYGRLHLCSEAGDEGPPPSLFEEPVFIRTE